MSYMGQDAGDLTPAEMWDRDNDATGCRCTPARQCLSCAVEDDDESLPEFSERMGFDAAETARVIAKLEAQLPELRELLAHSERMRQIL